MVWHRRRFYGNYNYKSDTTKRIEELCTKYDFNTYANEVFGIESKHIDSITHMREILYSTSEEMQNNPRFSQYYGVALVRLLENNISVKQKRKWGSDVLHNYVFPNFILENESYINQETKDQIIEQILKYNKNFYSKEKKVLVEMIIRFSEDNNQNLVGALREFHRILSAQRFDELIQKIPQGLDNPDVKNILSKTRLYDYLKYSEESIKDEKEKIKLTKAIAKTPTLIKRLPFKVNIEFDHLKEIAPATRFRFMQFAFKRELDQSRYGWSFGEALKTKISYSKNKNKEQNLIMPSINLEQMKELLFSVCLKKNAEFVRWIKLYELYLACLNATERVDIKEYQ